MQFVADTIVAHQDPQGPQGVQGEIGPTGPTGSAGLSEYAYIYNLDAQVIALEADILFSTNGIIVGTIAHAPETSSIQLGSAGDYAVWVYAAGVEPNQFTVFQNGAPVAGAVYGSGAGTQANLGLVIITAASGDALTVRNHTSAAAVTLQILTGGTQINTNAFYIDPKDQRIPWHSHRLRILQVTLREGQIDASSRNPIMLN